MMAHNIMQKLKHKTKKIFSCKAMKRSGVSRRFFLILLFVSVLVSTVGALELAHSFLLPSPRIVSFEIKAGEGVWDIGRNLSAQGVIGSPLVFVLESVLSGSYKHFVPGIYDVGTSTVREVVRTLVAGPQEVVVTIIPGMTLKEIDALLAQQEIISAGSLSTMNPALLRDDCFICGYAQTLEGIIAPDTYKFYRGSGSHKVAFTMARRFESMLRNTVDLHAYSPKALYQKIIIASLLEKEVRTYEEKRLVAGVIQNRINADMPLQIDASVAYGACNGVLKGCTLTRDDFKSDTPFNTYIRTNLPPAPIASVSEESLRAAFNPQASSYFYYLTDPDTKTTHFSVTFDEHDDKRGMYFFK